MTTHTIGQTRRAIEILHNDDTPSIELEIGKAAKVDTDKQFIYMEEMTDGKWRLTYTGKTIPDFSNVAGFRVLREDEVQITEHEEGGNRMSVAGEPARTFLQLLVELFEQNGGKNFLSITLETPDKSKRYEVRIVNLNGELSVTEKLNQYEEEIRQLQDKLANPPIAFPNYGFDEERFMLQNANVKMLEDLAEIQEIIDSIPRGGSKEGRPDYVSMLTGDKVARLRELTNHYKKDDSIERQDS
jgi:hypothetical protein